MALALAEMLIGGMLVAGLSVAGPAASMASTTAPADEGHSDNAPESVSTPATDGSDGEPDATEPAQPDESEAPDDESAGDESTNEEPAAEEPGDEGTDAGSSDEPASEDGDRSQAEETEEAGDSGRNGDGASESDEANDAADEEPDFAPLAASVGNSTVGSGAMTFSAYVAAGENLDIAFTKIDQFNSVPLTINVSGPGGETDTCTVPAGNTPGVDCSFADLSSGTSGIWEIDVVPSPGTWPRLSWEIDVQDGTTSIPGRVFTTRYHLWQDWNSFGSGVRDPDLTNVDLDLWYVSEDGYQYAASYNIYNGNGSTFVADGVGNREAGTCVPAYRSLDTTGPNVDPDYETYDGDDTCGEPYKIFFEAPAGDLPQSATRPDGSTDWLVTPVAGPAISNLSFTPDGGATHAGALSFDVADHTGAATVLIDTDGDGAFNGPDDVSIPTFVTPGSNSVDFDGEDAAGNPVPNTRDINARVVIDRAGEIHFVNRDVERRSGGLEVTALNGPDAGSTTLYWDDRFITVANRCSTTANRDGRAGVDSTGGTHNWGRCSAEDNYGNINDGVEGSWGDARAIDDWTYHSIEEFEEITIPGEEPEPWSCAPGASGLLFQATNWPDSGPTDVQLIDMVTGEPAAGPTIDDRMINATAYNVLDDFVYGWDLEDGELVRIGANGLVEEIPTDFSTNTLVGEIDENGQYWVLSGDSWYQIDLAPGSATYGEVADSGPIQGGGVNDLTRGADWAFVPGGGDFLYRVMYDPDTDEFVLMGFNRGTGQFQNFGSLGDLGIDTTETSNEAFGAVYADPDGFLYASNNGTGEIFRIDVQAGTASHFADGPASSSNDGARCFNSPIPVDWADAPAGYGTLLADDGPRHLIPDYDPDTNTAPLMLGELIDIETDGVPGADADGDDADNVADEDGVAAQIVMTDGQETAVNVSATNDTNEDAILAGWIDLDGNGTFDPGELVTETVPAGSGLDSYELTFPVGTATADTYARFRLFPGDTDQADVLPTGSAGAGEVEDYPVTFLALDVDKTSDATEDSRIGDTVTYTVTLTNSGTSDYTAANPARYRDDLTDVLDDATLDEGSLSSDRTEQPTFDDPYIDWAGELPANESVVITYEVELTGDGDGVVRNVAFVPPCDPADSDCDVVTPECDPPDENGRDPQTGLPCAEHEYELPRLEIDKTADTTELPAVGETVTYTVVATNVGPGDYTATAPAPVTDDLTEVLDDATFDEASLTANPSGTLEFNDPIVSWEGVLAANESVTIEYTVTYTGEGDQLLTNEACVPEDEVAPGAEPCDSIEIPGPFIVDEKSVSASDDPVEAGTVLTYTLTFENEGEAAGTVDKVDDLNHVLDDGDLTAGPTSSDAALSATGPDADNRLHITGTLDPDQVVTVTYEVTVKPDGERGDNRAVNFLMEPTDPPPCEPADPDCVTPPCEESDEDCTETLIPEIVDEKSVSASDDPVEAGTVLTYTLTFENEGEAAGTVDKHDDLKHVLDDGDLTAGPTSSDAALSVSGPDADNRLHITGTLDPDQEVTVTYEVTVKPDGERGDNIAKNFLVPPGEEVCDPGDPDCDAPCEESDEDCTETLIPEIVEKKSVDPESGSTVLAGDVLTYTLTFENVGEAPGEVDEEDVVAGVLDDAELTDGPTTSDAALSVSGPTDGRFHVTGTLDPDQEVTVTYEMTVKPDGERGDNVLENFLVEPGKEPPEECEEDDPTCTENRSPEIVDWKAVDPASGTPVTAGEELTYTLTFTNEGAAAGEVDKVDDVSHMLDDAELISGPTVSDAALTASGPDGDGRISITGELDPDQTVTVTYTVRVKESGERGDDVLANFLLPPDKEPPPEPECEPADDELPDCTRNPVGDIKPSKSVNPESGTEVEAGEELTYTITFENVGKGADDVDYTDHAADVFDDAELVDGPTASGALSASGPDGNGRTHITGELAAGDTATVTYAVRVKDHEEQGDNHLGNFVTTTGEDPPEECLDTNPLCTENPIKEPPPKKDGGLLPTTGAGIGTLALLGATLLLAGLVFATAARRRRDLATGERSGMLDELL